MRDGTVLRADVWLPRRPGPSPTLVVVRTPYDRAGLDVLARLFAERGHSVVVQNCRGTFGSEGEFDPFRDELSDGEDTLDWLARQPWGDLPVTLIGASYFGHTAYSAIAPDPGRVAAVAVAVTATDMRAGAVYPDGVLASEMALFWIAGVTAQQLPRLQRFRAFRRLGRRMTAALAARPADADRVLLGETYPPYQDWLRHDDHNDDWWEPLRRSEVLDQLPSSALIAGWYDPFVVEQLADYAEIVRAGRPTRLVVGPWTHGSPAILAHLVREGLQRREEDRSTGATIWDEGLRRWIDLPSWPPITSPHRLALSAGDALFVEGRGDVDITWSVDPSDPPPAAGGRGLNPDFAGRRRQEQRERRTDVQVFTGSVQGEPLTLAGAATLRLRTEAVDHTQDWFVRLCDVDPRGVSRNIADGFARVGPDETSVTIRLSPAAFTFGPRHRVRLQIAGTAHPFHPLPATAGHRRVLSRPGAWSVLELPTVHRGWEELSLVRGRRNR